MNNQLCLKIISDGLDLGSFDIIEINEYYTFINTYSKFVKIFNKELTYGNC